MSHHQPLYTARTPNHFDIFEGSVGRTNFIAFTIGMLVDQLWSKLLVRWTSHEVRANKTFETLLTKFSAFER